MLEARNKEHDFRRLIEGIVATMTKTQASSFKSRGASANQLFDRQSSFRHKLT
jgi:hypothetical protein